MKQMEKVMALVLTALILLSIPLAGMAQTFEAPQESAVPSEPAAEPGNLENDSTEPQPTAEAQNPQETPGNQTTTGTENEQSIIENEEQQLENQWQDQHQTESDSEGFQNDFVVEQENEEINYENMVWKMRMNVRETPGIIPIGNPYELSPGVELTQAQSWFANSAMTDSEGVRKTLYTSSADKAAYYYPNRTGNVLAKGTYDVYFWLVHDSLNETINLDTEVHSDGGITRISCADLQQKAGNETTSRWVKIGNFHFAGGQDEYVKMISTGYARIADIKFERTGLYMDVRKNNGSLADDEKFNYELSDGVALSGERVWRGDSSVKNSQGAMRSLYTTSANNWVKYYPNLSGFPLYPGTYDVYFWYAHYEDRSTCNLEAHVYASGTLHWRSQDTFDGNGPSKWMKIGTYQFSGDANEYLMLTSFGMARIADVKFVRTDNPTPPPSPTPETVSDLTPNYSFDDGDESFRMEIPEDTTGNYYYGTSGLGGSNHTYCDLDTAKGIYTINGVEDGIYEVYFRVPAVHTNNTNMMTVELTDSNGKNFVKKYDIRGDSPGSIVSKDGIHSQDWVKLDGRYIFKENQSAALIMGKEPGTVGNFRCDTVGLVKVGEACSVNASFTEDGIIVTGNLNVRFRNVFLRVYDPNQTLKAVDQVMSKEDGNYTCTFKLDEKIEGTYQVIASIEDNQGDAETLSTYLVNGQASEIQAVVPQNPVYTYVTHSWADANYYKLVPDTQLTVEPWYIDYGDSPSLMTVAALYDENGIMVECLTDSISFEYGT